MQTLEQDWYGHDHPEEKYRAEFSFSQDGDVTTVRLRYSGNIYDEQRDISDWQEYYFDPIKKLLEE
jgi:activator of HSP90 ATPase